MPGAPREIVLLTNPTAGRGRGARARAAVLPRLRAGGLAVRDLRGRDADEALTLARAAVAERISTLVVVGGDGTVNMALQAVAGSGCALGVVPAGTGDDLARCLGLPRRDPLAAAERVLAGRVRTVDLARAGGRYFATVLAAGFDAVVNERANTPGWPRGRLRYPLATAAELRTFRPIRYILDLDGTPQPVDAMLVAVGNAASFGGGLRIAEGARLDDGLLDVVVIGPVSRAGLVRTYPRLLRGTHVTQRQYRRHRVRCVGIAAPGITAYADGERFGPLPITVDCVPNALLVLS